MINRALAACAALVLCLTLLPGCRHECCYDSEPATPRESAPVKPDGTPKPSTSAKAADTPKPSVPAKTDDTPPPGFISLFNKKDLTGWRGGETFDHRKLLAMSEADRKKQIDAWTATMTVVGKTGKPHWSVDGNELVNDGEGAYATTEKDYGDIELRLEYKTVPLADSGIYLRGCPQVQIWDHTNPKEFKNGAQKGSGGLWNNSPGAPGKDPLVLADKPFGEWNTVRVIMTGARVTVWLNEKLTVDHAILENYYDRKTPIPRTGPLQLQTHGGEIRWRNVFLREIGSEEANKILASHGEDAGFKQLFNGKDFTGWAGSIGDYEIVDGAIQCKKGKGGFPYYNEEFSDFVARLEIKLPPAGNNGLAIRYPGTGDTAYVGMCELQVLDDDHPSYAKLDPRQYFGSVYGVIAAHRGYLRPVGQWNFEEVTVKGTTIKVELNGTVIVDGDVSKIDPATFMGHSKHPGLLRTKGFFGFAGHNDPVGFRAIRLKPLAPSTK